MDLSIWAILPVFALDREGRLDVEERHLALQRNLADPANADVAALYERSVTLMTRHLLLRHLFLTLVAAVTLVGLAGLYVFFVWSARRIVSGALQPPQHRNRIPTAA
jgi:hypothetical protein